MVIGLRCGPITSEVIALCPSWVAGFRITTAMTSAKRNGQSSAMKFSGPIAAARSTSPPMR